MKMGGRILKAAAVALFALAFYSFYLKYVPLIPGFQALFLPVGLLTAVVTAAKPRSGALVFLASFPLVNNWPYFFGVQQSTPHAPAALVLALFFFFGIFLRVFLISFRRIDRTPSGSRIGLRRPKDARGDNFVFGPMRLAALLIAVSAALTAWKWTHFYPLRADGLYDFVTNVNGVTAGGAQMSTLFGALSYLCGFALFVIFLPLFKERKARGAAASALGASLLVSVLFGLVQHFADPGLGNTAFWEYLGQVNATFKDPNAFGAVLAGLSPFFLGAAFHFRGAGRILFGTVFGLSLAVFPFIGARSALLGLVGALAVFSILAGRDAVASGKARGEKPKKPFSRLVRWGTAVVLAGVAVAGIAGVFSKTRLFHRISNSLRGMTSEGGLVNLSPERYFLWKEAVRMTLEYPLNGVGIGAFIIELPNSYARDKAKYPEGFEGWRRNDSAENYFLQAAAELGLPGLAAIAALFWAIGREIRRAIRRRGDLGPERFLLFGATAGLAAFGLNMLFHSYSGSFETQFAFWVLAAFVVSIGRTTPDGGGDAESGSGERVAVSKDGVRPKPAAVALVAGVFLYAGAVLWNQSHALSLAERTKEFGWGQEFGLYQPEKTGDGRPFHWTRKEAGISIKIAGPVIRIPVMASHPDIARNPVRVEIVLVRDMFRSKKNLREIILKDGSWTTIEARVSEYLGQEAMVLIKVGRTWNPKKATGVPDPRNLGVALGEITFPLSSR